MKSRSGSRDHAHRVPLHRPRRPRPGQRPRRVVAHVRPGLVPARRQPALPTRPPFQWSGDDMARTGRAGPCSKGCAVIRMRGRRTSPACVTANASAELGAVPSIGSIGDSYDNAALAGSVNGLNQTELKPSRARPGNHVARSKTSSSRPSALGARPTPNASTATSMTCPAAARSSQFETAHSNAAVSDDDTHAARFSIRPRTASSCRTRRRRLHCREVGARRVERLRRTDTQLRRRAVDFGLRSASRRIRRSPRPR